eukprot:13827838-Alexandrium_andersonii.AAC.1
MPVHHTRRNARETEARPYSDSESYESSDRSVDPASWSEVVEFRPTLATDHPGATDVIAALPREIRARQA